MEDDDLVAISALNAYLYCDRRCALRHTEGLYVHNVHTATGTIEHEHADAPGQEYSGSVKVLRALPLLSRRVGLTGKSDVVELPRQGPPLPVEYKHGPRRRWDNDEVQLCAQALCLEEMLRTEVPVGALFHVKERRRSEVRFTEELRHKTETVTSEVRALLRSEQIPLAVLKPQCQGCSLHELCLPELRGTALPRANELFRVR